MHSRKDAEFHDDTTPFPGVPDHHETTVEIESVLGSNGERRSWKKICAAKRTIERLREREHLKEMLSDAYDEDDLDDLESEQIKLSEYLDDD